MFSWVVYLLKMIGRRLGGSVMVAKSGEERLQKLEMSAAYGGKPVRARKPKVGPSHNRSREINYPQKRIHGIRGSFKL